MALQEVDLFLGEVDAVLTEIPALLQSIHVDIERVLLSAEWLLRDVLLVEHLLPLPHGEDLVISISEMVASVREEADRRRLSRRRGRPTIDIPEDQLAMLFEHHFCMADVARMMGVSARTIRRRVLQYGLESSTAYSALSDAQLDEITLQFVPYSGRVRVIKAFYVLLACVYNSQESVKVWAGWTKEECKGDLGKPCIAGNTVFVCLIVSGILMATTSLCVGRL